MKRCAFTGCDRVVYRDWGPWCLAHQRQRSRGTPMRALRARGTPWDRLFSAALAVVEADVADDRAWSRANNRLRKAALAYRESHQVPRGRP